MASARTAANVVYNTSGEISAGTTSLSKQIEKSRRTTASGGWDKFKVYTLPSASSSPSARCRRRREAALFEPRHSASGSVLLKVVAALFDNLKVVLSPSYVPSRKFKEAAADAPPTPALCGSELPRRKERMCRV